MRAKIRNYILSSLLYGEDPRNLKDDTHLISTGVLDSRAILDLVIFIEREWNIEVAAHEVNVLNFDRVDDMVAFVEAKVRERLP